MSWLDTSKSEHIIRREHFVAGYETARENIIALLQDNVCPTCEQGDIIHKGCGGNLEAIAQIQEELK